MKNGNPFGCVQKCEFEIFEFEKSCHYVLNDLKMGFKKKKKKIINFSCSKKLLEVEYLLQLYAEFFEMLFSLKGHGEINCPTFIGISYFALMYIYFINLAE